MASYHIPPLSFMTPVSAGRQVGEPSELEIHLGGKSDIPFHHRYTKLLAALAVARSFLSVRYDFINSC